MTGSEMYSEVLGFLAAHERPDEAEMNSRTKYSSTELASLELEYPGIPREYLCYLRDVGCGAFRECQYMVYGGFMDPTDIFDEESASSFGKKILIFGDNFSGDPAGFLPEDNWSVVELWHDSLELHDPEVSFGQFIRREMLMDEHGNDTRKKAPPSMSKDLPNQHEEYLKGQALRDAQITSRKCAHCDQPLSSYRKPCKYCGRPAPGT